MERPALPMVVPTVAIPSLFLFPQTRVSICVPHAFYLRLRNGAIENGDMLEIADLLRLTPTALPAAERGTPDR